METSLNHKHCKPCEAGVPPLHEKQIAELITHIPQWTTDSKKKKIHRRFTFKNFFYTMSFVNAIAHIANQEGHHPDLKVGYNYCEIEYTTHAIDGLSENDFICAKKMDGLLES